MDFFTSYKTFSVALARKLPNDGLSQQCGHKVIIGSLVPVMFFHRKLTPKMAAQQAICHVLLKESTNYLGEVWNLPRPATPAEGSTVEGVDLIADGDSLITGITSTEISLEIRMKWVKTISDMFSRHPGLGDNSSIRDWDLRLGLDG